jgi:hypothetical protein
MFAYNVSKRFGTGKSGYGKKWMRQHCPVVMWLELIIKLVYAYSFSVGIIAAFLG